MPDSEPDVFDARRRRLLFRATHRGTHENDLMFGGFVRTHLAAFTTEDLDALESLLELPDNDLADWLTGRRPIPDDAATPMLRRIRASVADGAAIQAVAPRFAPSRPLPGVHRFPNSGQ